MWPKLYWKLARLMLCFRCNLKVGGGMTTAPCYPRIAFLLIVPLLLATTLAAQQDEKQGALSLTVDPARITLNAGQTQRFLAHIEGAPAGTVIRWAITDRKTDGSSISQDGVFTARRLGLYHVVAFATIDESTVLKTAVAKVTVLGQLEF
jgi:hypothetical protein